MREVFDKCRQQLQDTTDDFAVEVTTCFDMKLLQNNCSDLEFSRLAPSLEHGLIPQVESRQKECDHLYGLHMRDLEMKRSKKWFGTARPCAFAFLRAFLQNPQHGLKVMIRDVDDS